MSASPTQLTRDAIEFRVYGIPQPQAGMRAVNTKAGPRQISTGGKSLSSWRNDVAAAAMVGRGGTVHSGFLDGPVEVWMTFRFPMPQSRPKRLRVLPHGPRATKPDLDKLIRAVGDALSAAAVIRDDAQIARLHAAKVETADGWLGCWVRVVPMADDETTGVWS